MKKYTLYFRHGLVNNFFVTFCNFFSGFEISLKYFCPVADCEQRVLNSRCRLCSAAQRLSSETICDPRQRVLCKQTYTAPSPSSPVPSDEHILKNTRVDKVYELRFLSERPPSSKRGLNCAIVLQ
jgi:hypothetical protein